MPLSGPTSRMTPGVVPRARRGLQGKPYPGLLVVHTTTSEASSYREYCGGGTSWNRSKIAAASSVIAGPAGWGETERKLEPTDARSEAASVEGGRPTLPTPGLRSVVGIGLPAPSTMDTEARDSKDELVGRGSTDRRADPSLSCSRLRSSSLRCICLEEA